MNGRASRAEYEGHLLIKFELEKVLYDNYVAVQVSEPQVDRGRAGQVARDDKTEARVSA